MIDHKQYQIDWKKVKEAEDAKKRVQEAKKEEEIRLAQGKEPLLIELDPVEEILVKSPQEPKEEKMRIRS